jgi:S-adenosylmethionine decarboxylase proenzyme
MKLLTTIICLFSLICLQATESEYQFKGNHFLASYMECDHDALIDLPALREALLSAAQKSGATVLDSVKYEFTGNGFTMVILLSESHASIHTYPEVGACFVDLFTCGDNCSSENFDEALRAYLKPEKVSSRDLIRTAEIQDTLKDRAQ